MSSRPCRSDIDSHVATRIMMRGPRAVRRARQPWPTMTAERRHITHERRDDIARRIRDLTLALEVLNHTIHDYVGRPRGRTVQGPWIAPGPKLPRCRRCQAKRQQRWRGSRLLDEVAAHRYRRARIRLCPTASRRALCRSRRGGGCRLVRRPCLCSGCAGRSA